MAEIVEFRRLVCSQKYGAITTNIEFEWDKDHSGRYVRESDYAALLERHKRMLERHILVRYALARYVGKFDNCGDVYDQAKSALAEEE